MELIRCLSGDISEALDCNKMSDDQLRQNLRQINSAVESLFHINNLMLMSINRCTDCAHVEKGETLKARNETFNLCELLEEPLMCMGNMQMRISLMCLPVDDKICPFIKTDKMWLKDNILGLLLNAVSHSTHGCVELSVTLELKNEICKASEDELTAEAMRKTQRYLRFEVSDHGEGVSEEKVKQWFGEVNRNSKLKGGQYVISLEYFLRC